MSDRKHAATMAANIEAFGPAGARGGGGDATGSELADVVRQCEKRTVYPLSHAQERLFRLAQADPESPLHIVAKGYRFRFSQRARSFSGTALIRALQALAARHEILRTTFRVSSGAPVQAVLDSPFVDFCCVDMRGLTAEHREHEATHIATVETQTPFELDRRPAWRARCLLLSDDEVVVLMVYHQLIIDGWSVSVVYKELAALYQAIDSRRPTALAEPLQYGHFAVWQRQQVACGRLAHEHQYWRRQLFGATWRLQLPVRQSTSPQRASASAVISFPLDAALLSALTALGNTEKATVFMTLLAAFEVLLMHWSGHEQMLIASPVAGRGQVETEQAIGHFLNHLLLRADLSGDPSFLELLRLVRLTVIDAISHQELPFELLLPELAPPEALLAATPVPVRFVLQNAPRDTVGTSGPRGVSEGDPVWAERFISRFDLSLGIRPDQNGGSFEFNTDLFAGATIEALIDGYRTLLERVALNPDRRLSELSLDIAPPPASRP